MKRVKLRFTSNIDVEFTDRETAIKQLDKIAVRGTRHPIVVYGPEGCGKTALLKQAKAVFEGHGYHVIYINPLAREAQEMLGCTPSIKNMVRDLLKLLPEHYSRIVDAAIGLVSEVIRRFPKPRIALLLDDVFQAVGLDKAEIYVKSLLNLIEYPSGDYDRIAILVVSSEGVSRDRIGRHRWATIKEVWNLPRKGLNALYDKLPSSSKPPFEVVWGWTGGNPEYLARLFEAGWRVDSIVGDLARGRKLDLFAGRLSREEIDVLRLMVEDPDHLIKRLKEREAQELERRLIELNLVIYMHDREPDSWIDDPPPERDPELGIGRYYAWQTPLHREAVRKALEAAGSSVI